MGLYICMGVLKKLLSYYFIDLCHILHRPELGPTKFINLSRLLIYRVLIYRGSTVDGLFFSDQIQFLETYIFYLIQKILFAKEEQYILWIV